MNRLYFAIVFLVLGGFCFAQVKPATTASKPAGKVHTVIKGDLETAIEGEAVFESADAAEVKVKPKVFAGEMTIAMVVRAGMTVKKGEVLMKLDSPDLLRDFDAARNELELARATHAKAKEDARLAEEGDKLAEEGSRRELANAQTALKWAMNVDIPNMLRQTELGLKDVGDRIEDSEDELEQLRKMYKTQDLTAATADIVVKRAVRGVVRMKEQQKLMEPSLTRAREVTAAQMKDNAQMAVLKADLALRQLLVAQAHAKIARQTGLVSADMALEKANRKVEELKSDVERLVVKSPVDGLLMWGQMAGGQWQNHGARALREGEKIVAGQVLMTVVPAGKLGASMMVPENKLASVEVGQKVALTPKLLAGATVTGRVVRISQSASVRGSASGFEVQFELEKVDGRILPGMTASAKVLISIGEALLVPAACLKEGKVIIRSESGDVEREVVVGRGDGKRIEVIKGLAAGEKVMER